MIMIAKHNFIMSSGNSQRRWLRRGRARIGRWPLSRSRMGWLSRVLSIFVAFVLTLVRLLFGGPEQVKEEEEEPKVEAEREEVVPLATPMPGYLVAAVPSVAISADGGDAPRPDPDADTDDELDGPPSTDDEDDVVQDSTSVSFSNGRKQTRDASFRKRSGEKLERAKAISTCLTSHLVTPAFHGRRITIPEQPAMPVGSRTSTITHRTRSDQSAIEFESSRKEPVEGMRFRRTDVGDKGKRKASLDSLSALASPR